MQGIFFTIKPEMMDNECPSFLRQYFDLETTPNPTWNDVVSNQNITKKFGHQGLDKINKSTGNPVKFFEFHFPSFLSKEILELVSVMAAEEMPDGNLDLVVKVADVTKPIPATIMSMFLPQTYMSGQEINWEQLFYLSDTTEGYTAVYTELDDGSYVVDVPDILFTIWGLFVKAGYYAATPEVAIYASSTEVEKYLEN